MSITDTYTPKQMLTSKSRRPPLRVHFGFQANVVTFRLLAIQNSSRARAQLPIVEFCTKAPNINLKIPSASGKASL